MKILHLHVKTEYYNQVKDGTKKEEYRKFKQYWAKRLNSKTYDLIYYYKGYTQEKMIFKFNGWRLDMIQHKEFGDKPVLAYRIYLDKQEDYSLVSK